MKKLTVIFLVLASVSFAAKKKSVKKVSVNAATKTSSKVVHASVSSSFTGKMMPTANAKTSAPSAPNVENMAAQGSAPVNAPMDVVTGSVTTAYGAR